MTELNEILIIIDNMIGSSSIWFPYLLLGTGVFFTIYLKFPQIRYFNHALQIVRGKFDRKTDEGDTTHFQALTTALSGTVGTGNIAGVALAIHIGGPAALFWMLATAFVGMTTKFVEVTLSHKYREKAENGEIAGGPMYFMKNKLNTKWLAIIFAIATVICSFGTGNLPQINSIGAAMVKSFNLSPIETGNIEILPEMIIGGILAILLSMVIIGGIKRIARVTEKLVPTMAIIYFFGAFAVIFSNYENVIPSFIAIFRDLFTGSSATGGFLGAAISHTFTKGVGRGLFSNEAGQGSAPIAHAAARTHEPVSEGVVAILEPFIDTIIICMITGLALLSSGVWNEKIQNTFQLTDIEILSTQYNEHEKEDYEKLYRHVNNIKILPLFTGEIHVHNGQIIDDLSIIHARSIAEKISIKQHGKLFNGKMKVKDGKPQNSNFLIEGKSLIHSASLTTEAFRKSLLGNYAQYIVSIGLLLFAFSTVISWSYYGDRAMTFLFGTHSIIYYRIIYIIAFFIGAFTDTTIVWTFSGIAIACMTIPNLIGILLLRKDMHKSVQEYWTRYRK